MRTVGAATKVALSIGRGDAAGTDSKQPKLARSRVAQKGWVAFVFVVGILRSRKR